MGYIYLRKNLSNGKCYVGQAKDIERRNREWNCLTTKYGGYVINNARAKYGTDGFSFELLKECPNEEMNYWEMYYIKEYNTKKPYGYNSTDGGDSAYERTEETKAKLSAALKTSEKAKIARVKIAAKLRGRKLSDETKAKMSATLRGRKLSPEHIAKVAAANRGKKRPAEVGEKVAAAHRGKKLSEKTKAKMSAAHINNPNMSKAVQALDKVTGEVIYEFASTQEAQRQGFSAGNISECCRNCYLRSGNNIYKGYIWKFKENAQEQ